jgi:hypothetical protein
MIVFGEAHLRRILGKYAAYYESRIHRSLNKDDPFYRAIERVGAVTADQDADRAAIGRYGGDVVLGSSAPTR